jgi:hypothetical protein
VWKKYGACQENAIEHPFLAFMLAALFLLRETT